jgi:hypothetical protein
MLTGLAGRYARQGRDTINVNEKAEAERTMNEQQSDI